MNIDKFEMMDPMKYYNNDDEGNQKRQDMVENKNDLYIATEKHDGDWGMFIHYSKDINLIRSRSLSKVTGKYGDLTEKLPHLVEEMNLWPDNSVVLAEICWNEYGDANSVGTVLRCKPPKAVERQKDKKLFGYVFDVLMWADEDLTSMPYVNRIDMAYQLFWEIECGNEYFRPTDVFTSDFAEAADRIIANGGEGVVIQLKNNPYMPGTRSAWKTLKLKKTLPSLDLKVVGTIDPIKNYEGNFPENWKFWEFDESTTNPAAKPIKVMTEGGPNPDWAINSCGYRPITKPYFYGWKNGIVVDFNGVKVSVTSGLTDADREWLATDEASKQIENGELYAEVKAMSVNAKDSLRHPSLVRLRNDM